jgi:periplasmic divalent cation tolerance protein
MIRQKKRQYGVLIISTYPDEESVIKVAKMMIANKKLCACVNFAKVRSLYSWKNKLEDQEEFIALFKTTNLTANKLKFEINNTHPYEVPEIVELKMSDVSKAYLSWMIGSTITKPTTTTTTTKSKIKN